MTRPTVCRAPWNGDTYVCEVHRSAWPSGAERCFEGERVRDRTYAEALAAIDWRLVGEAPVTDLPPCVCGEERVDPVGKGFRCIACGAVRQP